MFVQNAITALLVGAAAAQKAPPAVDPVVTPGKAVGSSMPTVGFGTWMLPNDDVGADAVARAIKLGYRHLDGATAYTNQVAVGKGIARALKENPEIKREHLWVTTKLWASRHKDVKGGLDVNLQQLGLDYVDLLLVHFPVGNSQRPKKSANGSTLLGKDGKPLTETYAEFDYVEMWQAMEKLLEGEGKGKVRHIGISNFNVTQLEDLLSKAKVKPYTHQIESHPYLQDWKFVELHQKLGVPLSAYAPLGNTNPEYHYRNWKSAGRLMLDDPVLKSIAKARKCTTAQVALKWNLERKIPVIVKSFLHDHQVENYQANSACQLTSEDMAKIKALDKDGAGGKRYWDMCCAMYMPCYLGLQDAPTKLPVPADYCEDPWKGGSIAYNPERTDLWATPKQTCERAL